jgi:predicted cupin superfamily sugar epimerase
VTAPTAAPTSARAQQLIRRLGLQPHPEGGFYTEVHRSMERVDPRDGRSSRAALTSIHYLLVDRGFSRWHCVASDEAWLHLEGDPVELHLLDWDARALRTVRLAPLSDTTLPQCVVPAGQWQAAQVEGDYALLACVVGPGFEFDDFALIDSAGDIAAWLRHAHPAVARLV